MYRKISAALIALLMALGVMTMTANSASAVTNTSAMYFTPKIQQTIDATPDVAANAASIGAANLGGWVAGRKWYVQHRARGSADAWVIDDVKSTEKGTTTSQYSTTNWAYWRAWNQFEYRVYTDAQTINGVTYDQYSGPIMAMNFTNPFGDEFNDTAIDPNKWSTRHNASHENAFLKADPSACSENSGVAKIKLIDAPGWHTEAANTVANPTHYGCHLTTLGHYTVSGNYWIVTRAKFQPRDGTHTGVWTTAGYGPGAGEFDIAEYPADQAYNSTTGRYINQNIYMTADSSDPDSVKKKYVDTPSYTPGSEWWDSYHTFAMRYAGTDVQFYVDGIKVYTRTISTGASTVPQEIIMSMLSTNYPTTPEWANYNQTYLSGYAMLVDWVEVYQ